MRIVVLNPHMLAEYSGPTELMHRMFSAVSRIHECGVIALGPELPEHPRPELTYQKISGPSVASIRGQIVWIVKANRWLWQNRARYDFVHLHGAYGLNLFSAIVPILLGRPFGLLPLAAGGDLRQDAYSSRLPLVRRFKRLIARRASVAFALSRQNKVELVEAGLIPNRVRRLNNPAAPQFFRQPPPEPDVSNVVVFIGSLSRQKRPELVLQAIRRLRDRGWTDAKGMFIGPFLTLGDQQNFETQVGKLALQGAVDVRGYTSDVAAELVDTRGIFVLPSAREGLPGALTEAMALGMPVVVTPVGAMGDVVSESQAGFVVRPDPDELADAIERIWADPNLRSTLASRAYAYAEEHYSEESVSANYLSSLRQLGLK